MWHFVCQILESKEDDDNFFGIQLNNRAYWFLFFHFNRLYAAGAHPAVSKLYQHVSYPVSRGTPMLNSHVGWDHSERFAVPKV